MEEAEKESSLLGRKQTIPAETELESRWNENSNSRRLEVKLY